MATLRIGARSSKLSMSQASIVSGLVREKFGRRFELELVKVKTLGDRLVTANEALGNTGKGAFTGDLETMLLEEKIDIAVHSMKDLQSKETDGLKIGATPPRSDPRDALVSGDGGALSSLRKHARIGTSSLRRRVQLLKLRNDLEVVELHGNVDTRIRKLSDNRTDLDAVVLAAAGLDRLGEAARISQTFSIDEMVPAVGQGIIAVQMRRDDKKTEAIVSRIDDKDARLESVCERAFAKRLGADCNVPVGGCARVSDQTINMVGMVANEDGSGFVRTAASGRRSDAAKVGRDLAEGLLARAAGAAS
ncbi:MAG TPA: hydroxymethylbilane synthase [Nitrososphaerales archaeon]|nr:hydroxymethylbilane synthase [Nitrososphaerales archaeon]